MQTLDDLDETFAAVFLVGIHARSGTPGAVMDHTWDFRILNLRVNGTTIGEVGLNALLAGHWEDAMRAFQVLLAASAIGNATPMAG